ncbi:sigma-54-dependent transcriptional regulator [Zhenpiania hominis]|uniref:Stage 0 sporulation protein A homolog n=1 Tax=Zhenpiania hominis TaxID=2763644 RepID=A0A923NKC3_9FIRM|nr:sigma-54 dependent transcriptional regulator [Zhenpiania hominis]MBC6680688.1 sigma-54-dependent Fis family transcriptional regulator [Zhenpiania hominis]
MNRENFNILVVDDEKDYCDVLKMILTGKGYKVDTCGNGQEAVEKLEKKSFDLVITDLCMPVMDGRQLLEEIKKRDWDTEVIMLTAHGTIEKAVDAMKAGAYSYVTKGRDPEELFMEVRKLRDARKMKRDNAILKEKLNGNFMLESRNKKYRQMMELAERAAQSDSNILILGESGTGKEVLASFIHQKSKRKEANFMELNCQALSESILESELFGHEKGAFTGADRRRIGLFEASNGGTLFLDEIGGVSVNLQAKLLKAIENKQIYRLGSSTPINVDFRLITATNHNLRKDMGDGSFRDDLFYRISTIVLELPPLRERPEDIPLFIQYFFDKYQREMNKRITDVENSVKELLAGYSYPGNVRELKNIIERLVVLSEKGEIREAYLPSDVVKNQRTARQVQSEAMDLTISLKEYRGKVEKAYIASLLERYPKDMNKVAEILDISRRQLFNKLVEYELK